MEAIQLSFKDGEEGGSYEGYEFVITTVENGYILQISGEESSTEVFVDKSELLKRLKGLL